MKSSAYLLPFVLLFALGSTINVSAQVTPEKYYNFYRVKAYKIDSCIIIRSSKDSVKRRDMVIAYDRKKYKMTFLDQFNGSKIVFQFDKDSNLLVQEVFFKNNNRLEQAGVDSFFYDSTGKKTRFHSVIKSKGGDAHININYIYRNDSLYKEEYRYENKVVKTVLHTYDRRTNTEIITTISDKEPSSNQYYQRDRNGKLTKFFIIELNGDTSVVHLYKYDVQGRVIETRTYDWRSNVSNIYRSFYGANGMIAREEEFLNIQFGDMSTAVFTCKTYQYRRGKQ